MPGPFFDPFGGRGRIVRRSHDKVLWYCEDSDGNIETCVQTLVQPVLDANRRAYNESYGKRWGDGQIVASIPLPLYFGNLGEALKNGDQAYVKRYLNDSDNVKLRTWRGKL